MDETLDFAAIDRQINWLKLFHRMDPDMPPSQIHFFLKAASSEGLCIADIARATGVKRATATRYLKHLSVPTDASTKGLGLLRSFRNPKRPTEKLVVLTAKGDSVVAQLALYA